MTSKLCWSLPGRSIESRARRIANRTTMMTATRISMHIGVDQGRSEVLSPSIESTRVGDSGQVIVKEGCQPRFMFRHRSVRSGFPG